MWRFRSLFVFVSVSVAARRGPPVSGGDVRVDFDAGDVALAEAVGAGTILTVHVPARKPGCEVAARQDLGPATRSGAASGQGMVTARG
ncbi:hypothetical protein ACFVUY_22910 [Kitasatospora sp. NPDC058063]|uniref:hypothetical protein n=1 Tax=unclassified Kitasatospora TaxID=2633591 RepID=UPI0036DA31CA